MRTFIRGFLITALFVFAPAVRAETVIASIKPVSLIAAELLDGVAEVDTLLPEGASPHDFSLRPSDRRRLDSANLIIWVGADTEPYLQRVIAAAQVSAISWQESAEEHAQHADEHEHEHEHEHEYEHRESAAVDEGSHDEHDHAALHPWLSPESAEHFSERLAVKLKELFPESSAKIDENEAKFLASLTSFESAAQVQLAPVKERGFFVFHDAYQGLVEHFELNQVGYFTLDPSRKPGAKHLTQLREQLEQSSAQCVFVEPQYSPALIDSITRGLDVKRGELDPLATGIGVASGGYIAFMQGLLNQFTSCLTD